MTVLCKLYHLIAKRERVIQPSSTAKEKVWMEDDSACISHAARSKQRRRRIMSELTTQLEEDNSAQNQPFHS
jgi:hypothetical protein